VLKKKTQREGVFREMKRRRFYEKPSEKSTREKGEAIRRAHKLARKKAQREGLIPLAKAKKPVPRTPSTFSCGRSVNSRPDSVNLAAPVNAMSCCWASWCANLPAQATGRQRAADRLPAMIIDIHREHAPRSSARRARMVELVVVGFCGWRLVGHEGGGGVGRGSGGVEH
jgi:small subunit ribosomal protein S21